MPEYLFTPHQERFIEEGPESVEPNNRWNREQDVRKNANSGVPQVLHLLPDLVPYLDEERIREKVDPAELGVALGQLFPSNQRRQIAAMLLWGEQEPDESTQEFLERVPEIIESYETELDVVLTRLRQSSACMTFLRRVSDRLQDHIAESIDERRTQQDIAMAVTVDEVVEFSNGRAHQSEPPSLPELTKLLFTEWNDDVQAKFTECWQLLLGIGLRHDVESVRTETEGSLGDQWGVSLAPSDEDISQYLTVVDALDDEIDALVADYFEQERIAHKDRVLTAAVSELGSLSRPAKDILGWDTLENSSAEWMGHHTRRATIWTDERDVPLLRLQKESGDRRVWEWTAYGELVRQLWHSDFDREQLEESGHFTDIDATVLDEAIAEFEAQHNTSR